MSYDLVASLASLDEDFMPDICRILTQPGAGSGADWSGTSSASDAAWPAVNDPASSPPSPDIPARVTIVPSPLRAQTERQGAETTLNTSIAFVPVRMRGLVKVNDHLVWRGTHYSISEIEDDTFATSLRVVLQVIL